MHQQHLLYLLRNIKYRDTLYEHVADSNEFFPLSSPCGLRQIDPFLI